MTPTPEELKPQVDPEILKALEVIGVDERNAKLLGIVADRSSKGLCVHPLVEILSGTNKATTYIFGGDDFTDMYLVKMAENTPPTGLIVDFGEYYGKAVYLTKPQLQLSILELEQKEVVIFDGDLSVERNLSIAVRPADYNLLLEGLKRASGKI